MVDLAHRCGEFSSPPTLLCSIKYRVREVETARGKKRARERKRKRGQAGGEER
jgi:hypothetical protein